MIRRKIDNASKLLEELRNKDEEFKTRSEDLEASIAEAKTEEELETVEAAINELEEEKAEHEEDKRKLEEEIEELEEELRELNDKAPKNNEEERGNAKMNKTELRSAINEFIRTKGKSRRDDVEGFKVIDGGALVPEELLTPEKEPQDTVDLQKYVRTIKVNRGSGKLPILKHSDGRMVTVEELEKNPELAKPQVADVSYDIDTYRGYIPVSQEVIDDADYDIVGFIEDDIKGQDLNTRNHAIAQILKSADAETVTGLDGIITLINTGFKNAYNIKVFVSKSLFNELDLLKDNNGRYLLEDDITVPSGKRIRGKEVVVLDDTVIGENDGDLVGFVGDAKAYCAFFDRKQTYVKWVNHDIYGEMLAGFRRFDAQPVHADAGKYITFEPETTPTEPETTPTP